MGDPVTDVLFRYWQRGGLDSTTDPNVADHNPNNPPNHRPMGTNNGCSPNSEFCESGYVPEDDAIPPLHPLCPPKYNLTTDLGDYSSIMNKPSHSGYAPDGELFGNLFRHYWPQTFGGLTRGGVTPRPAFLYMCITWASKVCHFSPRCFCDVLLQSR